MAFVCNFTGKSLTPPGIKSDFVWGAVLLAQVGVAQIGKLVWFVFFFFIGLNSQSFALEAEPSCGAFFSNSNSESSNQFLDSLGAVLDYAVQHQLVGPDFLRKLSAGSVNQARAAILDLPNTAQVATLKSALSQLFENDEIVKNWKLAKSAIQNLLVSKETETAQRDKANSDTELIMTAKLTRFQIAPGGAVLHASQWHVSADGQVLLAVPLLAETLIYNFKDLNQPTRLTTASSYMYPQWHTSHRGETLLAIPSEESGDLVVYNLTGGQGPKKFTAADATPFEITRADRVGSVAWLSASRDKDYLAYVVNGRLHVADYETGALILNRKGEYGFESDDAHTPAWEHAHGITSRLAVMNKNKIDIFQIGHEQPVLELKVDDTSAALGRPSWSKGLNGKTLILTTREESVFVFDLSKPQRPIAIPLDGKVLDSPIPFQGVGGENFFTVRTERHVYLFDESDLTHPEILADGTFEWMLGKPAATTVHGRTLLAVPVSNGIYIYDLADIKNPFKVPLAGNPGSDPSWHTEPDGTTFVTVTDLNLNLNQIQVIERKKRKN